MATSITTSIPQWLAGCTYDASGANDLRNSDITATWLDTGILTGSSVGVRAGVAGGAALKVSAATGMTVTVGPGSFVVPNSASAIAGGYRSTLPSSGTLTVATSDPVNPRIDLVVANVVDNGNSSSFGQVQILTGTPAGSPVAPTAPANSVSLATIAVAANATSILAGNIADVRIITVTAGGVVPAPKSGSGSIATGYNGLLAYDSASGSFYHAGAAGAKQARVLPFAPVHVLFGTSTTWSNPGFTSIGSASVTTDGATDIKVTAHLASITQAAGTATGAGIQFVQITVDGVVKYEAIFPHVLFGSVADSSGLTATFVTCSAAADTPSAATHTIGVQCQSNAAGSNTFKVSPAMPAGSSYLRVEPVTL